MVAAAARGMGDATYVRHLALGAADEGERIERLATAGRLEAQWKQLDMAAYEMAMREGEARGRDRLSSPFDALRKKLPG